METEARCRHNLISFLLHHEIHLSAAAARTRSEEQQNAVGLRARRCQGSAKTVERWIKFEG